MSTNNVEQPIPGPSRATSFSAPPLKKASSSQVSFTLKTTIEGDCPYCHRHDQIRVSLRHSRGKFYNPIHCEGCHRVWITIGKAKTNSFPASTASRSSTSNNNECNATISSVISSTNPVLQSFGGPRTENSSSSRTNASPAEPSADVTMSESAGHVSASTNLGLTRRFRRRAKNLFKSMTRHANKILTQPQPWSPPTVRSSENSKGSALVSPQSLRGGEGSSSKCPNGEKSMVSTPSAQPDPNKGKDKAHFGTEKEKVVHEEETVEQKAVPEPKTATTGPKKVVKKVAVGKRTSSRQHKSPTSSTSYLSADPESTTLRLGRFPPEFTSAVDRFYDEPDSFLLASVNSRSDEVSFAGIGHGLLTLPPGHPGDRRSSSSQGSTTNSTFPLPPSPSMSINTSVGQPHRVIGGPPPTPVSAPAQGDDEEPSPPQDDDEPTPPRDDD
jgi:hypothetical protein